MIQIKSGITITVVASLKIQENIACTKNILFGILLHVAVKNGKYLGSIIDDSVITCDEVIQEKKTIPANFNEQKNINCETFLYFTYLFIN